MPRGFVALGRLLTSVCLLLSTRSINVARAEDAPNAHTVEAGETLSQIAVNLGVDQDALIRFNGLDDADVLKVGQSLRLPPSVAARASAPPPAPSAARAPAAASLQTYSVAEG